MRFWRVLLLLSAVSGAAQEHRARLSGEVSRGSEFRRDIGSGLVFALTPTAMDPGAIEGWDIKVFPKDPPKGERCDDFVWVATPPFRFNNPRYLDTSYGTKAEDAVTWSPREFQFVLNCADYKREEKWVERLLWPYNYSDEQVQEARAKLGSSPLGKGRLKILDFKISPAEKTAGGVNLGRIDWLKFELEISLPYRNPVQ